MSPRPYNLGKRSEQIDQGRRQILDAARALLREASDYRAFTLDAVATQADVARGTVYYQFGSKTGLLEAVCDDLGELGLARLPEAFGEADPAAALAAFVACFGTFWQVDRSAMRRLRALAALDPDVHEVIATRDRRRTEGLDVLVNRLASAAGTEPGEGTLRALGVLTSFETFDGLAGPDQPLEEVAAEVVALIMAVLDRPGALP